MIKITDSAKHNAENEWKAKSKAALNTATILITPCLIFYTLAHESKLFYSFFTDFLKPHY
jgi:hypothetical protein